jgi:phage portal protein BeeE
VAKLFQTLFRGNGAKPSTGISRYDVNWYLQQLNNPYAAYTGGGSTLRHGRTVEEIEHNFAGYVRAGYKANGPIFAIVLARLMLFTEARFQFRRLINGRPGDLFGGENGELSLLERPWPNGTTGELLARMEQDASFAGNSYDVNEGDRLRRLRPDWVSIVLSGDPDEEFDVDVLGYAYTPGGLGRGETKIYLPEEVCHWSPIPDPESQYRGMSWLTPVIRELQADQAATDHKSAFFKNGASPRLVVSLKESVREEQFKKFVRAMADSTGGTDQAYKTMYLAGGADVTVAGADLRQLDFRATQGAGETRLCAAGGVPPIIVGLSEGLQAATYSNYASARRKFGDHWARPQWRSACAALASITEVPDGSELWYDDRDIAFLREDMKDAAVIRQTDAATINTLITAGFTAESAVNAVVNGDMTLLEHSGMVSVQLQPPGEGVPETDPALAGETPAEGDIIEGEEAPPALPSGEAARAADPRGVLAVPG